jgi:hypothetical protein
MQEKLEGQYIRDRWLAGKWDDKSIIETKEELFRYLAKVFIKDQGETNQQPQREEQAK